MKTNIFANGVPAAVNLPFVTVSFMPEPVASDVQSLNDIPHLVLEYIDATTSLVHQFFLKIERKTNFTEAYDPKRAADLLRDQVHESIVHFGGKDDKNPMSLDPRYPFHSYEGAGHNAKLRASAAEDFMRSVVKRGMPQDGRCDPESTDINLHMHSGGAALRIMLPSELTVVISNFPEANQTAAHLMRRMDAERNDPSAIHGTAKLFGKSAKVRVSSESWMPMENNRAIRNWLTQSVLHDAIHQKLQTVVGETFGPLTDEVLNEMIDGLVFNLPD